MAANNCAIGCAIGYPCYTNPYSINDVAIGNCQSDGGNTYSDMIENMNKIRKDEQQQRFESEKKCHINGCLNDSESLPSSQITWTKFKHCSLCYTFLCKDHLLILNNIILCNKCVHSYKLCQYSTDDLVCNERTLNRKCEMCLKYICSNHFNNNEDNRCPKCEFEYEKLCYFLRNQ